MVVANVAVVGFVVGEGNSEFAIVVAIEIVDYYYYRAALCLCFILMHLEREFTPN